MPVTKFALRIFGAPPRTGFHAPVRSPAVTCTPPPKGCEAAFGIGAKNGRQGREAWRPVREVSSETHVTVIGGVRTGKSVVPNRPPPGTNHRYPNRGKSRCDDHHTGITSVPKGSHTGVPRSMRSEPYWGNDRRRTTWTRRSTGPTIGQNRFLPPRGTRGEKPKRHKSEPYQIHNPHRAGGASPQPQVVYKLARIHRFVQIPAVPHITYW